MTVNITQHEAVEKSPYKTHKNGLCMGYCLSMIETIFQDNHLSTLQNSEIFIKLCWQLQNSYNYDGVHKENYPNEAAKLFFMKHLSELGISNKNDIISNFLPWNNVLKKIAKIKENITLGYFTNGNEDHVVMYGQMPTGLYFFCDPNTPVFLSHDSKLLSEHIAKELMNGQLEYIHNWKGYYSEITYNQLNNEFSNIIKSRL